MDDFLLTPLEDDEEEEEDKDKETGSKIVKYFAIGILATWIISVLVFFVWQILC